MPLGPTVHQRIPDSRGELLIMRGGQQASAHGAQQMRKRKPTWCQDTAPTHRARPATQDRRGLGQGRAGGQLPGTSLGIYEKLPAGKQANQ